MKKPKTLAIALALGDLYDQAGRGYLRRPIDGSIARFRAVIDGVDCNSSSLIVCTAGYSKNEPRIPQPERQISLAVQLYKYMCREEYLKWLHYQVTEPLCWSTRNEVRLGIKVAQRRGFAHIKEEVTVRIASNAHHLLRIWLYAMLYTPKNWEYQLVRARHQFTPMSHLLEVPKFLRDLLYVMRVKHRLSRLNRLRRLKK